ncbi:MAG: Ig-like domain-containing protein, partial [Acidobacteria bacterium]|nr:Ig-like domain-containing protein [Acidobacteriota bacterium]
RRQRRVRQEFLSQIQEDKLLKRAEEAFNQGKYDLAQYFYRLLAQKQPGQTFDSEIKRNEETQTQKKQALTLYEENKYPATYIALKALLKVSPEDKETKSIISSIESQKIQPMIETGNKYFNEKNYKEAIPFFEEVLTFIPGDQEIKGKLTACREMMEKEKAASIIKEGKKIKKKFPLIPVLIGIVGVSVIAYFLLKKKSPKTGSINIISNPNGAVIWLDNVNTENTTPATLNSIASGSHTVKLVKAGYQEYTKNITVERGKVTQVNATLTPIPEITTSSVNIQIPEGNQTSFEVWLSENPPANVTLTISKESGDPDITVLSGSSLIFSPDTGKNHQIVTLAAASDDDTDNGTAIFKIHADGNFGILDKNITAVEQDAGSKGVLTVTPAERFFSTGKQAGPFLPASKTYILQNTGKGAINWTAAKTVDWITLSGGIGTLPTGGYTTVIVSLNENVNTLTQGNYSDTISFINNTNGLGTTTRLVDLQVTAPTDIPPTVSIQSPANSATVYGTVSIQVTAVDDHGVNKVEIYIDGTFFTSLINSPYIYQWNTISIANGSHTIIAKAYDTINQTNEAQVNITVSNSTMTLTPADNFSSGGFAGGPFSPSTYSYTLSNSGPNTIQWTLANTKNWLTLSSTVGELSSGESIIVSVTINENANTLVTGVYTDTLTFINSTNGNGNTSRSVSLQVNTDNLPTVSIQSPTNGAIVNGTVNIQVQATDDRGINKVEILIDNTLAATLTTSPYIYSWNTTAVANGSHTIKAFAYDTINQKKDVQVGVTVTN